MKHAFKAKEKARLLDLVMDQMKYRSNNKGRQMIKSGHVTVNDKPLTFPNEFVKEGSDVCVHTESKIEEVAVSKLPFPVLFENDELLAVEKPAGWISASPDKRKRSAFSVVRSYLRQKEGTADDVFFVNKLPKDASGILLVAKSAVTRVRLQEQWNKLPKKYYVVAKGQFPDSGHLADPKYRKSGNEDEADLSFPFRLMVQGKDFALLKMDMMKEAFSELFSTLEALQTPVPGYARRGKADDPMGRLGLHFFSVDVELPGKEAVSIKTRVPRTFLRLVKHQRA